MISSPDNTGLIDVRPVKSRDRARFRNIRVQENQVSSQTQSSPWSGTPNRLCGAVATQVNPFLA